MSWRCLWIIHHNDSLVHCSCTQSSSLRRRRSFYCPSPLVSASWHFCAYSVDVVHRTTAARREGEVLAVLRLKSQQTLTLSGLLPTSTYAKSLVVDHITRCWPQPFESRPTSTARIPRSNSYANPSHTISSYSATEPSSAYHPAISITPDQSYDRALACATRYFPRGYGPRV